MFWIDLERYRNIISGNSSTSSNLTYDSNITSQIVGTNNGSTGPTGSFSTSQIIDAICEGPIEGWPTSPDPLKYVYLDGTPVKSYNSTINTGALKFEFKDGTSNQTPLTQYTVIGSAKTPNFQAEIEDIAVGGGSGAIIQQVQIRDDSDGAYPVVEAVAFTFTFPEGVFRYKSSGGRSTTPIGVKIEINPKADGTGTWYNRINTFKEMEVTSGGFDWTFIVELPPGWATAKDLQKYTNKVDDIIQFRITKFNSDHTNDRAHSKMYLKSYTIYTRNQYSYPYTALAGLTIDSKNFDGSIPRRTYELKLLKVKIPSNYNIVTNDKTGEIEQRNYVGQWDGTFKEGYYWTDNPAWCFYDLVTNERYGLGKFINPTLLNKWRLYEIAKYCDAVAADTRSTYVGGELNGQSVPPNSYTFSSTDNIGGISAAAGDSLVKEARFTCNIMITSREEAYSVVQRMASLFRSITFFQQGTLEVIQDKPATATYLYNNTNVAGGTFSYSSSGAKARHTVAIVKWVDPDDLYSEKLEYVEDYDGIARYGYREIEIDGFGCTSKGQARRLGRHILITEKFELETVSFVVGLEGGVVTPGSIIRIEDSYRQTYRSAGRVASATSSSITLDKAINIPTGATAVTLWVQTPNAQNEVIDTNTAATYRPRLDSYSITVPAFSPAVLSLSPTTTVSPIPSAGNIWGLSYTESGDTENTSLYKVLSVTENNPFEYEITALQHYSSKYTEIEEYEPIPSYRPTPLKLFVPPPTEGFISSKFNGTSHDITVSWRTDRYISGTKYKVEIISSNDSRVLASGVTDTTYVYPNASAGTYYFKIYSLSSISSEASTPLLVGPFKVKEVMPQNNFDTFAQTEFSSDYITHSWPDDVFPNDPIKYELWRAASNSLRTLITSAPIQSIDYANNKVTLTGFNQAGISSPDLYSVEATIFPYSRYQAVNVNLSGFSPATSPGRIVIETSEKPLISIGDKVVNATRNTTTNIYSVTQTQTVQDRWVSSISVAPSVTSQVAGDLIYTFKGVAGSSLLQTQPSGVIKQKTFTAGTSTTTSILKVTSPDTFTNVLVGDVITNRTRGSSRIVSSLVSPTAISVSPTITGQTSGDTIAYYQASVREARKLRKYNIDWLGTAWGGDSINVLNYDDPDSIPVPDKSIMMNITKGYSAEVVASSLAAGGVMRVSTWPSLSGVTSPIADNDEVIFFNKDEVYTSSISTHIHPTTAIAAAGTSPGGVTATGLFTSARTGDILVNATRNTSSVILSKISNNQVTLVGSAIPRLAITNQTSGDAVFVVLSSSNSFVEDIAYNHPTVYTTATGTTTTTVNISPSNFTGVTSSYVLYNMTRNTAATVSPVSSTAIAVSPAIVGQTVGDRVYVFLPTTVTTTTVTAPDGAFSYARPGDIFYNVTRDGMTTIKDVVTLTGALDRRIDKIILSTPISTQKTGDEFRIIQGFFRAGVISKQDNGSNDILQLETVSNLELGDRLAIYQYTASKIGTTAGNTITDTGLDPSTTYYYWMRAVSARLPFLGGIWKPSRTTGDSATTIPLNLGNYNTSNDNNGSPIFPSAVTPVSPFIDLPPGGRNPDSSANIRLYWEWTGIPSSIDGFSIYFWSSNSTSDNVAIDNDNDFIESTTNYSTQVNPRVTITAISPSAGSTIITTSGPHSISNGDKVRIIGAKVTGGSTMPNINNTTESSFYTASLTSPQSTTFTVSPAIAPTGTYLANSGAVTSCQYVYQVNNLTANYYYNAWIQPYRKVNTATSENGVILGSPKKLY